MILGQCGTSVVDSVPKVDLVVNNFISVRKNLILRDKGTTTSKACSHLRDCIHLPVEGAL
eukprot:1083700-Amphidinium_carterae.1